jgi:hypothetical protein
MQSDNPSSKLFPAQDINCVIELEAKRKEKGYALGWLFYQCKPLGLVKVMEYLRAQGRIESPSAKRQHPARNNLLTIELVPETCWFSNVRSEVSDQDWKKIQKITFQNANYLCEICSGRGPQWPVECHEIWHYDDINHTQTLLGFIALCPSCHEVKHRGYANVQGRGDIADRHLAKVNQWTMPKTRQYVEDQYQVWIKRSQSEWELDISWLEQLEINPKAQRSRTKVVAEGKARNNVRVIGKASVDEALEHYLTPEFKGSSSFL